MKYIINITQEQNPLNPRKELEPIAKMLCTYKNYNLGDKKLKANEILEEILNDCKIKYKEKDSTDDLINKIINMPENKGVALPLSIYEHSGITMKSGILKGWDYSFVGFIYMNKDDIKKNLLPIQDVKKVLESEINLYSNYIEGNVYSLRIEKYNVINELIEEHDIDGFYGVDFKKNGILDTMIEIIEEEDCIKYIKENINSFQLDKDFEVKTENHDNFQPDFEI